MASCPKCRFAGAHVLFDGQLKCANCGNVYNVQLAYPPVPRSGPVSTGTGGARKVAPIIVALAVGVIVLAGFIVTRISDAEPEHHHEASYPHSTQSGNAESSEPEVLILDAKIGETVFNGMNSLYPWWVVSYRNTGTVPIQSPRITAKLFDEEEKYIQDAEFGAYVLYLPPGETAWVFCSPTRAKNARKAEFKLNEPQRAGKYMREYIRLQVRDVAITPQSSPALKDYPFVTGNVRNASGLSVRVSTLQAIGYDDDGQPCAYTLGHARESNLRHGDSSDFKLNTGAYIIRQPVRWEVDAWGSVRE